MAGRSILGAAALGLGAADAELKKKQLQRQTQEALLKGFSDLVTTGINAYPQLVEQQEKSALENALAATGGEAYDLISKDKLFGSYKKPETIIPEDKPFSMEKIMPEDKMIGKISDLNREPTAVEKKAGLTPLALYNADAPIPEYNQQKKISIKQEKPAEQNLLYQTLSNPLDVLSRAFVIPKDKQEAPKKKISIRDTLENRIGTGDANLDFMNALDFKAEQLADEYSSKFLGAKRVPKEVIKSQLVNEYLKQKKLLADISDEKNIKKNALNSIKYLGSAFTDQVYEYQNADSIEEKEAIKQNMLSSLYASNPTLAQLDSDIVFGAVVEGAEKSMGREVSRRKSAQSMSAAEKRIALAQGKAKFDAEKFNTMMDFREQKAISDAEIARNKAKLSLLSKQQNLDYKKAKAEYDMLAKESSLKLNAMVSPDTLLSTKTQYSKDVSNNLGTMSALRNTAINSLGVDPAADSAESAAVVNSIRANIRAIPDIELEDAFIIVDDLYDDRGRRINAPQQQQGSANTQKPRAIITPIVQDNVPQYRITKRENTVIPKFEEIKQEVKAPIDIMPEGREGDGAIVPPKNPKSLVDAAQDLYPSTMTAAEKEKARKAAQKKKAEQEAARKKKASDDYYAREAEKAAGKKPSPVVPATPPATPKKTAAPFTWPAPKEGETIEQYQKRTGKPFSEIPDNIMVQLEE